MKIGLIICVIPFLSLLSAERMDIEALLNVKSSAPAMTLEAESLEMSASSDKTRVVDDSVASGGKWVMLDHGKSGDWMEFEVKDLPAGYYQLSYQYNRDPRRGAVAVTVNGEVTGSFDNQRSRQPEGFVKTAVGSFFQPCRGVAKIRFNHIGTIGGTNPGISVDTLYIEPAPLRDDAIAKTSARNGGYRVDAVAEARRLLKQPPQPGRRFSPYYALPAYPADGSRIPSDALDCRDYPSVKEWMDAMEHQKKPGKIGSGTYELDEKILANRCLTQSIYGYDSGEGMPVIDGKGRPSLFYFKSSNIIIEYLHFKNIGIALLNFDHWKQYGFGGKKGLHMWFAYQPDTHPDMIHDDDIENIAVMDCSFTDVGMAMLIIKEFHAIRNIHVGRNNATGGKGFVALPTHRYRDIHFYQNKLTGFDQKTEGGNWANTLFWTGTNDIKYQKQNRNVFVEFNYVDGVISSHRHYKVNASAFCDIRDCSNVSISYNVLQNLVNTAGNSDCNAVYSKSDNLMIDHCMFRNCGANEPEDDGEIGSEGGCLTLKGDTSKDARFGTIVQDCFFDAGTITSVPMVLFCHNGIMRNCTFRNWQWTGHDKARKYLIHKYSGEYLFIVNPKLINCGGEGALLYREANALTAGFGWKDVNFNNNSTEVFTGFNLPAGAVNEKGELLVNVK